MNSNLLLSLSNCHYSDIPSEIELMTTKATPQKTLLQLLKIKHLPKKFNEFSQQILLRRNLNIIKHHIPTIPTEKITIVPKSLKTDFKFLKKIYLCFCRLKLKFQIYQIERRLSSSINPTIANLKTADQLCEAYSQWDLDITPFLNKKQLQKVETVFNEITLNFENYYRADLNLSDIDREIFKADCTFLNHPNLAGDIDQLIKELPQTPLEKLDTIDQFLAKISAYLDLEKVKIDGRKSLRATAADDEMFALIGSLLKSKSFTLFTSLSTLRPKEISFREIKDEDLVLQKKYSLFRIQSLITAIFQQNKAIWSTIGSTASLA